MEAFGSFLSSELDSEEAAAVDLAKLILMPNVIPDLHSSLPAGVTVRLRITRITLQHDPSALILLHPYPIWINNDYAKVHDGSLYIPVTEKDMAESLTEEPVIPCLRIPPRRFTDTIRAPAVYQSPYDMYYQQYFDVINNVLSALDLRFQQSVFPLLRKVEKFIIAAANDTKEDDSLNVENIVEFLNDDIDIPRLKCELNLLSDYFSTINLEKNFSFKKITKIQTIFDLLNAQSVGKTMFHEYCKLLRLYLTIPITTATAERYFSTMNRIKTYLRSTMTHQRFNHVIISHIHKEKLDQLD
ncbi:unnamed protein product [Rotaria sp. Silwood1]|nr:unnamed protein product [Rotaria sp. Silwood1]